MQMRATPLAVALVTAALLTPLLPATEYHVAGQAPGASDSNSGLAAASNGPDGPWRTVRKAAGAAAPGDTVYVHAGDYRSEGVVTLNVDGQPGAPVRFVAASGEDPIVQGFSVRERRWLVIEGFTIRNRDFTVPGSWLDMPGRVIENAGIVIDPDEGWSTREGKVRAKYATYMSMIDQWENTWRVGIDVKTSSDIILRGNDISYYTLGIQLRQQSTRVTVEDNEVHHCRTGLFTWRATPSLTDSDIVRNVFRQNLTLGVDVREYAEDVRVEDNLFEHQGASHIHVHTGATRILVKNNMARYGGYYTETMQNPGSSAINFNKAGPDNIAEGNVAAYQVDDTQLDGNGFIIDLMYDTPVTLRNNIAYRNSGSGITTTRTGFCTIVNNSFIENGYLSDHPRNGAGIRFTKDEDRGHVIANNVFLRNRTAGVWTYRRIADVAALDGNLYYQPGSALVWDGGSTSERYYTDLAAVRSATGREVNGVEADPAFVSNGEFDYHLSASSPARSAAIAGYAPLEDFEGDIRDASPDIGHDEHTGTDSVPPTVTFVQPNGEGSSIEVDFSEHVTPATAAAAGNYQLDGGAQVLAAMIEGPARVRLETTGLENGRRYALAVDGVRDLSGNATAPGTSYQFDFAAASELVLQRTGAAAETASDVELSNAQPNQNFGVRPMIEIGASGTGIESVGLLEWDASAVPAGAQLVSGELEVVVAEGAAGRVEAFGLLREWQEAAATWMQPADGEAWDSEGAAGAADRSGASSGVGAIDGAGRAKVRLNSNGLALVQSWVDGNAPNHGFVIAVTGAGSAEFVSSEGSAEAERPRLVLRYEPAPTSEPPPPPTGLEATAVDTQSVTLSWSGTAAISSYRVFVGGSLLGSTPTPSYLADGLAADTAYEFHVVAVDALGQESEASAAITVRTAAESLEAPTNLRVTDTTTSSVALAWSASAGAQQYRIYRDGSQVGSTASTSYAANGLSPDTAYSFHVTAVSDSGQESGPSNSVSARTSAAALPAPTNLRVTETTTSSVALAWNASAGAQQYRIYRDGSQVGSTASTSYAANGLSPDTAYGFHVTAVASDGRESAPSNAVSARTQAGTPAAPRNLIVSSTASTSISLAWSAPSGGAAASSYRVYRDGSAVGSTAATSFTASGLSPDTQYSFWVTAIGADGSESAASNTVASRTPSPNTPPVVSSISVLAVKRGSRAAARAKITLLDGPGGTPVGGALLTGYWTHNGQAYSQTETLKTNGNGLAQSSENFSAAANGVVGFVVTAVQSEAYSGPIGPYSGEAPLP